MKRFLPLLALLACSDPKPPTACGSLPQMSVFVGERMRADPCFEDPEGGEITLSVLVADVDIAKAGAIGLQIQVEGVAPGSTEAVITATDPDGLTATLSLQIVVPNRAPTGTLDDVRIRPGMEMQIDLSLHFSDPDGQSLTYSASSSASNIVAASVSGSILTLTPMSLDGSAQISVTASDGDEETTIMFAATILPPVDLIEDEFDSEESLDDWTIAEDDDYTSAEVDDGYLVITGDTSFFALVSQEFGGEAIDLTVNATVRTTDENAQAGFWVWTGHDRYQFYVVMLGEADYGGNIGMANWIFAWWDDNDDALYVNTEWSMGTSGAVEEDTDLDVVLVLTEGAILLEVEGRVLLDSEDDGLDLDFVVETSEAFSLAAGPESTDGGEASVNRVKVTAADFTESGPAAHQRPAVINVKSLKIQKK